MSEATRAGASLRAVALVATLDTKADEAALIARVIEAKGRAVVLLDAGTGGAVEPEARSADPAALLRKKAQMLRKTVTDLHQANEIGAIIGIGGGKGSALFSEVVADLPYGFPKLLVSSARPALLAEVAKSQDILLYPTLVDLFGVNGFTERVLKNAAEAVAALEYTPRATSRRKMVAITAFGVTTPAVNQCLALLGQAGVEGIVFPANGAGGRKMEALISAGEFDAVLDLTTTELADELLGGTASAGPDRLTSAARYGIPQLIAPGAVDMVNFGAPQTLPDRFRARKLHQHTPFTTLMRTNRPENQLIGRVTGEKLSLARAPATVLWPSHGFSDYDREGGVFHDLEADRAWLAGLRETLPASIPCVELDCHINDPAFANAATEWILEQVGKGEPRHADVQSG